MRKQLLLRAVPLLLTAVLFMPFWGCGGKTAPSPSPSTLTAADGLEAALSRNLDALTSYEWDKLEFDNADGLTRPQGSAAAQSFYQALFSRASYELDLEDAVPETGTVSVTVRVTAPAVEDGGEMGSLLGWAQDAVSQRQSEGSEAQNTEDLVYREMESLLETWPTAQDAVEIALVNNGGGWKLCYTDENIEALTSAFSGRFLDAADGAGLFY